MATIKEAFQYAAQNPNSEFAKNLAQLAKSGSLDVEAKQNGIDLTPFKSQQEQQKTNVYDLGKTDYNSQLGGLETAGDITGVTKLAEGVGQTLATKQTGKALEQSVNQANDVMTNLIIQKKKLRSEGKSTAGIDKAIKLQQDTLAQLGAGAENIVNQNKLTERQVIGSAIQTAANFIPGAGKQASLGQKVLLGAGQGYAYDVGSKLQNEDKSLGQVFTPGLGTGVGAAIPVASKIAGGILSRLTKGVASATSGVSEEAINSMINNPETAKKTVGQLAKTGNATVLEKNARDIVNGVSQVKNEARRAYGEALQSLAKEDIKPKTFKDNVSAFLDKIGSSVSEGKRTISNVEFTDPKNIKKASELIDRLQKVKLDGVSLRKLSDDIESAVYKTATSDERLSFNAFLRDMSKSLKDAIVTSTPKFEQMNAQFTKEMQLAQSVENIFGKVKFKNASEVNKVANKLESLFSEKGLDPSTIDKFLSRIGINPADFRASEAVRQISNQTAKTNTPGVGVGEMIRTVTSQLITPKLVRDIAIKIGTTEQALKPVLDEMSEPAKKLFLSVVSRIQ